ncbi:hypothetical protein L3V82_03315 [Thiotrichales bacterium 19S3-7]|nr:hypothetical protein [Thiotrichales bacterium 19S3-7]MCF6801200.1 hypothetical protein [Thiotrichales bacterium 19S3-11]
MYGNKTTHKGNAKFKKESKKKLDADINIFRAEQLENKFKEAALNLLERISLAIDNSTESTIDIMMDQINEFIQFVNKLNYKHATHKQLNKLLNTLFQVDYQNHIHIYDVIVLSVKDTFSKSPDKLLKKRADIESALMQLRSVLKGKLNEVEKNSKTLLPVEKYLNDFDSKRHNNLLSNLKHIYEVSVNCLTHLNDYIKNPIQQALVNLFEVKFKELKFLIVSEIAKTKFAHQHNFDQLVHILDAFLEILQNEEIHNKMLECIDINFYGNNLLISSALNYFKSQNFQICLWLVETQHYLESEKNFIKKYLNLPRLSDSHKKKYDSINNQAFSKDQSKLEELFQLTTQLPEYGLLIGDDAKLIAIKSHCFRQLLLTLKRSNYSCEINITNCLTIDFQEIKDFAELTSQLKTKLLSSILNTLENYTSIFLEFEKKHINDLKEFIDSFDILQADKYNATKKMVPPFEFLRECMHQYATIYQKLLIDTLSSDSLSLPDKSLKLLSMLFDQTLTVIDQYSSNKSSALYKCLKETENTISEHQKLQTTWRRSIKPEAQSMQELLLPTPFLERTYPPSQSTPELPNFNN